jgi:phosphatidylserine/phosphatidylglycerophosphate/cardiolipin synthase-like enzyme
LGGSAQASEPLTFSAQGTLQLAFTPGDDVAGLVIATLGQARKQVLVQAYSFTHRGIAEALVAAKRRGLDVRVLADREQMQRQDNSQVGWLAAQGVAVWVDGDHAAAHNKVMVIDAGSREAAVITGSFNFTQAGQHRNAENLLVLRGNLNLAEAYAANWRRHRAHSLPLH